MEMVVEWRLELKNQKPAGTGWIRRVFGPRKVEFVVQNFGRQTLYSIY